MNTQHYDYDLIIIGGGPVGMALALALRGSGTTVLLLEARGLPTKTEDPRPLALSHGSRLILQRLGVWDALPQATPITTIHISDRGGFGRTVLNAAEADVPALGYVLNHHDLFRSMYEALTADRKTGIADIDYVAGAQVTKLQTSAGRGQIEFNHEGVTKKKTARLLAVADGGRLTGQIEGVTQHMHDYQQWAVVAHVKTERRRPDFFNTTASVTHALTKRKGRPHRSRALRAAAQPGTDIAAVANVAGVAYERFTPDGPVALLPFGEHFALVWTVSPSAAQEILALDDAAFLARLHDHFGDRLGKFVETSQRSGFPLALKYVDPVTACRVALVGNAAQTLHPVAGQGFNLGLRDAWELAEEIVASPVDLGTPAMLVRYRDKRRMDSGVGRMFTDSLVRLFSNDNLVLGAMRSMGLSALDCLPPAKRFVARRMIFGARG
ncbi:FAD-dependent monooxygenase [Nitrosovibrio tenuis]|uniref:2-octaprenyl-6-methoxyphenol hydroxylase n=1 Tax=Nitrosovibrio tenuis TaxID=1233 RepID=A0A1H7P7T6_9PROT|nr:FAD-dependent monooxygenase [Nitrosovibrio tenuis]SEL31822.1 2-octaprenyl-6-methoxyphenol hydroxylase [Nitrosovibrio tenuis]